MTWEPGDPIYPFEPDYEACSNEACGTTWTAGGGPTKACPECGSAPIVANPDPAGPTNPST